MLPNYTSHVILFYVLLLSSYVNCSLLFGFKGKDSVVLSSSSKLGPNGLTLKSDFQFIRSLTDDTIVGFFGDHSDIEFLHGELIKLCKEEETLHGRTLSTTTLAEHCRYIITQHFGNHPLSLNVLIAGMCSRNKKAQLYLVDAIGSMKDMPYIACGREISFILSLLDNINREKSSLNEVGLSGVLEENELLEVVSRCWKSVQQRSILDYSHTHTVRVGGKKHNVV
ncbi:hypothetical protein EON65_31780 [archaeon]|nr:MAG: hypothetical protein EON65_31780 [archaeon]